MKVAALTLQQSVEHDILEYMIRYPSVQGTIEDIVEWWIVEMRIRRALKEVRAALEHLTGLGWVTTRLSGNGKTYYQINLDKERDILNSLAPKPRRESTRRKNAR